MLRQEGNSKYKRCTFLPGLQNDNNILGYKEYKVIIILFGLFQKNKKPAVNFSNDRFLNQQLVNIIRMNHGAEVTAGLEPGKPRDTRDNFCVSKGDFL